MKFTLKDIEKLIAEALKDEPTGNPLLDSRYDWYTQRVAHPNPYYRLFYLIARELKPNFVVELGSYRATAAAHFALGNPKGQVVTIDIHKDAQQAEDKAACVATANQIDNLRYVNKWTWDALEDVESYNKGIDILFIDAWHKKEFVEKEQALYFPLLTDPALVICDDVLENAGHFPGMEKWWEGLPGEKILNDKVHPKIPMGFLRYVKDNRSARVEKPKRTSKPRTRKTKKKVSSS